MRQRYREFRDGAVWAVAIAIIPLGLAFARNTSAPVIKYGQPVLATPDVTCRIHDAHGELIRSMTRRADFLRMIGYPDGKVPAGHEVNHIVPLRCGGCDVPSNMELMTTATWKARTGPERYDCGRHPGGLWSVDK